MAKPRGQREVRRRDHHLDTAVRNATDERFHHQRCGGRKPGGGVFEQQAIGRARQRPRNLKALAFARVRLGAGSPACWVRLVSVRILASCPARSRRGAPARPSAWRMLPRVVRRRTDASRSTIAGSERPSARCRRPSSGGRNGAHPGAASPAIIRTMRPVSAPGGPTSAVIPWRPSDRSTPRSTSGPSRATRTASSLIAASPSGGSGRRGISWDSGGMGSPANRGIGAAVPEDERRKDKRRGPGRRRGQNEAGGKHRGGGAVSDISPGRRPVAPRGTSRPASVSSAAAAASTRSPPSMAAAPSLNRASVRKVARACAGVARRARTVSSCSVRQSASARRARVATRGTADRAGAATKAGTGGEGKGEDCHARRHGDQRGGDRAKRPAAGEAPQRQHRTKGHARNRHKNGGSARKAKCVSEGGNKPRVPRRAGRRHRRRRR
jgi:hypothetical protein